MIFQGSCASLRTGNTYATASHLRFSRFAGHTCEAYYRLAGVSRERKFLDSHTAVLLRERFQVDRVEDNDMACVCVYPLTADNTNRLQTVS